MPEDDKRIIVTIEAWNEMQLKFIELEKKPCMKIDRILTNQEINCLLSVPNLEHEISELQTSFKVEREFTRQSRIEMKKKISELKDHDLIAEFVQYEIDGMHHTIPVVSFRQSINEIREFLREFFEAIDKKYGSNFLEKFDGDSIPSDPIAKHISEKWREYYNINEIREDVKTKGYFLVVMADLEELGNKIKEENFNTRDSTESLIEILSLWRKFDKKYLGKKEDDNGKEKEI